MIRYITFKNDSNIYRFDTIASTLDRKHDTNMYCMLVTEVGTYTNFKGETIEVFPGEYLMIKRGFIFSTRDLNETLTHIEKLQKEEQMKQDGCENDCCITTSLQK